jgi:hypothetical protein
MKGIYQKDYKRLILSCIDNAGYSDQSLVTDADKLNFAADTLQAELGWMIKDYGLTATCKHWLQGLAIACTIPFYNSEIIQWGEQLTGRSFTDNECDRFVDEYWTNSANALYMMIKSRVLK